MSLENGPTLETNLRGKVLAMAVVGYISCGTEWYDYVDFDDAFNVMSKAVLKGSVKECTFNPTTNWLDERHFLVAHEKGYSHVHAPKEMRN